LPDSGILIAGRFEAFWVVFPALVDFPATTRLGATFFRGATGIFFVLVFAVRDIVSKL